MHGSDTKIYRKLLSALIVCAVPLLILLTPDKNPARQPTLEVVKTYESNVHEDTAGLFEEGEYVILETYYEMSNGTWKTDHFTYQHRLELTGRLNNAVRDSSYVILSNNPDITFEQAWKASGLSSHLDDYFEEEETVIVAIK